jgi:hypothetical protein
VGPVRIYARGSGVDPRGVVLGRTDGSAYGVDFTELLSFPGSIKASRLSCTT